MSIRDDIHNNASLSKETKCVIVAALSCVGAHSHGKSYMPETNNWKEGSGKVFSGAERGLNCWTAVLFWAFQGGALGKEELNSYVAELRSKQNDNPGTQMQAENEVMYSFLRANPTYLNTINETDKPAPGLTIFFGDPAWQRPMNHVVLSLGGGLCVSQQSLSIGVKMAAVDKILPLNPGIDFTSLVGKGLTHISSIEIIANSNDDKAAKICVSKKVFWEQPRLPWAV